MSTLDGSYDRWPATLVPKSISFIPSTPALSGPQPISGQPQFIASDAGSWKAKLKDIPIFGTNVLTFRAMLAIMQGPLVPVLISPNDQRRNPRTIAALANGGLLTRLSDGSTFQDGTELSQTIEDCALTTAAALRATVIRVTMLTSAIILAGHYIGFSHRMYRVARIHPVDGVANTYDLNIWPPFRDAGNIGDRVVLDDPLCPMVCTTKDVAEALDVDINDAVTLDFAEVSW